MKAKHYSNRNIMSYDRNKFPFRGIIGTRGYGKSFSAGNLLANQYKRYRHLPEDNMNVDDMFLWIRLTKKSLDNMKGRFLDPKLERKHKIQVEEIDNRVYFNGRLVGYKLALQDAPSIKGGVWPWTRFKYVIVDEFQRERKERRTFDVVYNLTSVLESTCRFTTRLADGIDLPYVIFMGNTVDESVDLLHAFEFLPLEYGRYVLRNKRAVIEYAQNSKTYDDLMEKNPLTVLLRHDDLTFGKKTIRRSNKILDPRDTGHRSFIGFLDITDHMHYQIWHTQNGRFYISKDLESPKHNTMHYTLFKREANRDNYYDPQLHNLLLTQIANNNIYFQSQLIEYAFMRYIR